MAGLDETPLPMAAARHDGLASCRLCASGDAAADHDWCPAVGGLVCEACCRRALVGDDSRLYAISAARAEGTETAEDLAAACMGCARGRRWFEEQLRLRRPEGGEPC